MAMARLDLTRIELQGHDRPLAQFRTALARGRLASSFLFVGPEGIGKRTFALFLAQGLLCRTRPAAALDPCGTCDACRQVAARSHPDLILVARPPDRNLLPIALLIGEGERRGQEGLCHDLSLRPGQGSRKIAILDDADFLNPEGANCLLKTLEEPPPGSLMILLSTSESRQLPTIRSRCQILRFSPLADDVLTDLILAEELVADRAAAAALARASEGSLARARELAGPSLGSIKTAVADELGRKPLASVRLGQTWNQLVDEAGKDAPARRGRLKQLLSFAAEYYRQRLRLLSGGCLPDDAELQQALFRGANQAPLTEEQLATALDRTLDALQHVDRFVQQQTILESWLDDLARAAEPSPLDPV